MASEATKERVEELNTALWDMVRGRVGKKLITYAHEDVANKLPKRPEYSFRQIDRILRSNKARRELIEQKLITDTQYEDFRKQWNILRPLYPRQTQSLRQNHSSKIGLKEGEGAGRAVCAVIFREHDRVQRDALEWFNTLDRRAGMLAVMTAYRQKKIIKEEADIKNG